MTNHATQAANHLAAVEATRDHLAQELASPNAKAHTVNVLRDDLRNGLKAAEVHALLNIGHHLAAMNGSRKHEVVGDAREVVGDAADFTTFAEAARGQA